MSLLFENLTNKLTNAFSKLKNKNNINKEDIQNTLNDIKNALLEADVNYYVVKTFITNIEQKIQEEEIWNSSLVENKIIKITHDELKKLLGEKQAKLNSENNKKRILVVGLQGSGKTTFSAKIANYLKNKENKNPLLVAADIYRPSAIDQLKTLGENINIPVFSMNEGIKATTIVKESLRYADDLNSTDIIIDTAGRLHVDDNLMNELEEIKNIVNPTDILLVVDSMTGQDTVNVSIEFHDKLNITGIVLSKMDGDSRGGVALTVKSMVGVPIKFTSYSEKMDGIDIFYPDRLANRILGKGDILTLVDKVKDNFKEDDVDIAEKILTSNDYNLEDFLNQIKQVKKMGPLDNVLKLIPGMDNSLINKIDNDKSEKEIKTTEAIINSMTKKERKKPQILNARRKRRISQGSATSVQQINIMLKKFEQSKNMIKKMNNLFGGNLNNLDLNMGNFNFSDMMNLMSKGQKVKKQKIKRNRRFPF